jgi:hypothetical protein
VVLEVLVLVLVVVLVVLVLGWGGLQWMSS